MIMGNPSYFEFLLTSFIWRMSPGEAQKVSPEEYVLMRSWTHIVIDGINSLLSSLTKTDKSAPATEELKEVAAKAGIKIPDEFLSGGENAPLSSDFQSPTPSSIPQKEESFSSSSHKSDILRQPENINLEGLKGQNIEALKNPHVYKAMTNSVADMKFAQYEKMGLLDLCIKQRNERLKDE